MSRTGIKKTMKKLLPVFLVLLMGCSEKKTDIQIEPITLDFSENNEETVQTEHIHTDVFQIPVTFSEAVALSDSIGIAEYIDCKKNEETIEYRFKIIESIAGELEENINLFESPTDIRVTEQGQVYVVDSSLYETGKQYLLIMNKDESLFYDYPHYLSVTNVYIPMHAIETGRLQGKSISESYGIKNEMELREALSSSISDREAVLSGIPYIKTEQKELRKDYTEAEDYETIIKESDYVLEVEVSSLDSEIKDNGDFYSCKVLNILKGEEPLIIKAGTEGLQIKFLKNSVEIGGRYFVMVNHVTETSYLYLQSAKNGVINAEEMENVGKVKDILGI